MLLWPEWIGWLACSLWVVVFEIWIPHDKSEADMFWLIEYFLSGSATETSHVAWTGYPAMVKWEPCCGDSSHLQEGSMGPGRVILIILLAHNDQSADVEWCYNGHMKVDSGHTLDEKESLLIFFLSALNMSLSQTTCFAIRHLFSLHNYDVSSINNVKAYIMPLSLTLGCCNATPSGKMEMWCVHIKARHDIIHDLVVSHRIGCQGGCADKSCVKPISSCASSTATCRSIPLGDDVHMWSTIDCTHEQHCEVYVSSIPNPKSLIRVWWRTVGTEEGKPTFGRPTCLTGAIIKLQSCGESVSAGKG